MFKDAARVTLYAGWEYVLVQAGKEQAERWRSDSRSWRTPGPDIVFPVDCSWLLSRLWDDDWRCLGGPSELIDRLVSDGQLEARRVSLTEDATPPGHIALLTTTSPCFVTLGMARVARQDVHSGHMALGREGSQRLIVGLIGAQAANAAFDALALYPIGQSTRWGDWAKQWIKDDLDRLGFPERFRFVFPIVKASSVAGLLFGLRWRALGRLSATAVVTYFVAALGFHARAKDPVLKYAPAVDMLGWSSLVLRSMMSRTG